MAPQWWRRQLDWLQAMIFPIFCLGCRKEGQMVCSACAAEIETPSVFLSFKTGPLVRHTALDHYDKAALLKKMILALKYSGGKGTLLVFKDVIERWVAAHEHVFAHIDMITAVPLHPRRKAERGYNQAELLARIFSEALCIPYRELLRRKKYTAKQASLGKDDREKNTKGKFTVQKGIDVKGKTILCIDDVFTTGNTMRSCALLLAAGGAEVESLSILIEE